MKSKHDFTGLLFLLLLAHISAYKFHFKLEDGEVESAEDNSAEEYVTLVPHSDGGFQVVLHEGDDQLVYGHIGRKYPMGFFTDVLTVSDDTTVDIDNSTSLYVKYEHQTDNNARKLTMKWHGTADQEFEDCFDFGNKQWYGGLEQHEQVWPIQNANVKSKPYVTAEADNNAVLERYWLNSNGEYIYVHPEVPLFVDYNGNKQNHICFSSQIKEPYSSKRQNSELHYDILFLENAKVAHEHAVENYLGKPTDIPDEKMIRYPIWSSWARYNRYVTQDIIKGFANEIAEKDFKNSQIEIDDFWENCYGSMTVDEAKFPDFNQMVKDLKDVGYRVTVWIHPFINKDCEPWYSEALQNDYFVKSEEGSTEMTWWSANGTVAGYVDFTNPEAADWWSQRLRDFQQTYDIDSFKFDAGESSHSPQIPVQTGSIELHPGLIVDSYVRTCSHFGSMIEVKAATRTQDLPVFVRMADKDSRFGLSNGLSTVITTLLQMNMIGYPLVLPDMIGGNGLTLAEGDLPYKELFIRWVQVNTFMPAMQFSYVPWDFDEEAVNITRKFVNLHEQYADVIIAAMKTSVEDGIPANPPIWWIDPTDKEALAIWDEYLVGESILVAPVLDEGAVTRNIYLPKGTWKSGVDGEIFEGPMWLNDYPAPLDTLPYFILQEEGVENSAVPIYESTVLYLLSAAVIYLLLN